MQKGSGFLVVFGIIVFVAIIAAVQAVKVIPAGHVGVATLFGEVVDEPYPEGLHFVNPLVRWTLYDARQKTHMEKANVPSQDQLQTEIDVSVQYRIIGGMASKIKQDTGQVIDAVNVHLIPKVRSEIREQGKTVERAEDFFNESTLRDLQQRVEDSLKEFLRPKGIEIEAVLIRDISLPSFITKAIERKKEREQEAEREKAELERIRTQEQQQIVRAHAEKEAAKQKAETQRLLADAEAYRINKLNEAIADNPAYVRLKAIEALKSISKDPASKIYFMNGDSPQPLPLMHIGDESKR